MTSPQGTITALLTPPAPGAIAVIGLAGPDVDALLAKILRHRRLDRPVSTPHDRPVFCRLLDEGNALDDVVVVRSGRAGIPIAEINTHGGVRIAQRTLALLEHHGARVMDGLAFHEQTSRENPVACDVDRALVRASGRRLVRWLLSQRAILPAYLEDRDHYAEPEKAAFVQRTQAAIRLIRGIRIALIGPANAGKSTLANHFIGRDEIITSDTAGTTRDWVTETALVRGWPVALTDTAGLRDSACGIESEAIRRSHEQAQLADLCVIVLDASQGRSECDAQWRIAQKLVATNRPSIIAMNKWDHPQVEKDGFDPPFAANDGDSSGVDLCRISALRGEGIEQLEHLISTRLGLDDLEDKLPAGFLPHHLPHAEQDCADSNPVRG